MFLSSPGLSTNSNWTWETKAASIAYRRIERCRRESKCIMHMHQFNAQMWSDEYFIRLIYKCTQAPSVCIVWIQSWYILCDILRLYQHFRAFCLTPNNGMCFWYTFCRVKWTLMVRCTKRVLMWAPKVYWLISFNSKFLKIKYRWDFLLLLATW